MESEVRYISNKLLVCHSQVYTIKETDFNKFFDEETQFAMVIAALCHDVGHRGKSNGFEINTLSNLAIRYHDNSVLEQYHAAFTMKIMMKHEYNILGELEGSEFRNIRAIIIECILATDMMEHFDMIEEVNNIADKVKDKKDGFEEHELSLARKLVTHMSDLSGSAKSFDVARVWSKRICQEFSNQVNILFKILSTMKKLSLEFQSPHILKILIKLMFIALIKSNSIKMLLDHCLKLLINLLEASLHGLLILLMKM